MSFRFCAPRRLALALFAAAAGIAPAASVVTVSAVVAGCGNGVVTPGSAQEAYDRGVEAYDRGKYTRAIEHLRTALDFGRTSPLAADAQLTLARAYKGDRQYLLAGNEYTRFIEFYRSDERVPQAAYERIQTYAALSPPYDLDQTDTERAIDYIRLYIAQYPESPQAPEAAALLTDLREKLAQKRYNNGRLYQRRELYEAAVVYYESVLQNYPTSAYADDAMLGALSAQVEFARASVISRQAERYDEALAKYDRFITLFPSSPLVREAEDLYSQAYDARQAVPETTAERAGQ
ncbi:outer membrane protein assembly factor BamD [Rubricoccus marinus]|uniref:outer membrane protein assembly factor BamD n=1 Tax=Rubricoccus marinus TaxID=716817 RepID=UPI000B9903A2|nr:outer membrane protein assembly factor BamD [Rubricoccus marinus]